MKEVWEVMWCASGGETEFEAALPADRRIIFQRPGEGAVVAVRPDSLTSLTVYCRPSDGGSVRAEMSGQETVICLRLAGLTIAVGVGTALGLQTIDFIILDDGWSAQIDLRGNVLRQVADIERRVAASGSRQNQIGDKE